MVVRLQKLTAYDTTDSSLHRESAEGQAQPDTRHCNPLLPETVLEEPAKEKSAEEDAIEIGEETACETSSVAEGSVVEDWSIDEDRCGGRITLPRGRDRSNTWSHAPMTLKSARRSGSLPPMDPRCAATPVSRLSLERSDSPFPTTPTCVSPFKTGKLLVCSEHRMSTSPRLPPIGLLSDLHVPRTLPKNNPRELTRDVTPIDPALVDNTDTTDVRLMGRRRNALMTPSP